jgi:hypothetical protein
MLRFAPRNLVVASTALAGLLSLASLPAAHPAEAADPSYCHAQFRACLARFSHRTCDIRYNNCMAYSSAPTTSIYIGGFPRFRRHHKDDPKTPPKTDPKGPIGGGDTTVPKDKTGTNAPAGPKTTGGGGTYTSQGWHATKPGGTYTSQGWTVTKGSGSGTSSGGGKGGGVNTGGGGKPQQQQFSFRSNGGGGAGGRSGGRR